MEKNKDLIRFISKIAEKFPLRGDEESLPYTDIHVRVSQDTGDVMAFDDEGREITRVVVEPWMNSPLETDEFYKMVHRQFTPIIEQHGVHIGISAPFNYILENESGEYISELYIIDDDETTIIGTPFMENLSEELDAFIDDLLKD